MASRSFCTYVHTCVGGKHLHEVFVVGWAEGERGRGGGSHPWMENGKMGLRFVVLVCEDVTAYTVKKGTDFPVLSRDVTDQTLPEQDT